MGGDTHLLTRLLSYSSSLAKRSVIHGAASDMSGFVRKDGSGGCHIDGEEASSSEHSSNKGMCDVQMKWMWLFPGRREFSAGSRWNLSPGEPL